MTHDDTEPLLRLSEAVDAFLARGSTTTTETQEQFLARHGHLRDLLEPLLRPEAGSDGPQDRFLGDYRLIREIGRGGMGVVYEAQDASLGRRVALKVLPPHLTHGPRQIERFRREASAAARLRHPGIVPVFSVGEQDGTHFFAMEYVDGPSVHALLARVRNVRDDLAGGFGDAILAASLGPSYLAQALEIVAQAAEALASAHAQGVIHRDIKPQNLLLAGNAVRIVDFGLAKDLDRASISRSAEVAGTPHYMSPEQVTGLRNVDHRTDVYSLGVLLYELLALQPPFAGESSHTVMHAITTQEPNALRKLNSRVPRDVEVICHRAMERDPAHRYQSAGELAADLRRCQRHEPIVAQSPGAATRVVKLIRRRKAASTAILLAVTLPALGAVLYLGVYRPALAREQTSREATARGARDVLNRYLARAEQLSDQPGMGETCAEMTKEAMLELERLREAAPSRDLQVFLAKNYTRLGAVRMRIGEHEASRRDFQRSRDLLQELSAAQPDDATLRFQVAVAMVKHAGILNELGEVAPAREEVLEARRIAQELLGQGGAVPAVDLECTIVEGLIIEAFIVARAEPGVAPSKQVARDALARLDAMSPEVKRRVWHVEYRGRALTILGRCESAAGEFAAAEKSLTEARRCVQAILDSNLNPRTSRRDLAILDRALGEVLEARGRTDDALRSFVRAVEVHEALHRDFPGNMPYTASLARCLRSLGSILGNLGRTAEAEHRMREAVRHADSLPQQEPRVVAYVQVQGAAWSGLARALSENDRANVSGETEAAFRRAIELQESALDESEAWTSMRYEIALTCQNLASWRLGRGEHAAAAAAARSAIGYLRPALAQGPANPKHQRLLQLHYGVLAESLLFQRDAQGAVATTRELVAAGAKGVKMEYMIARNFARAASLLGAQDELGRECRREALRFARLAVQSGLPARQLRRDNSFAVLQQDPDWQQLVGGG